MIVKMWPVTWRLAGVSGWQGVESPVDVIRDTT